MLPPPLFVATTTETRLRYVWQHFRLAYEAVPAVIIGYEQAAGIVLTDHSQAFFAANQPYPPAPVWRSWLEARVPFFFDGGAPALLALSPGQATIHSDVVGAAFYLLSGWQEYYSAERDQHGRFPYAASVQQRYGFVDLPVVNYYFEVLRAAVEHISGQRLQPRRWRGDAPFAAFISHDIDTIHGGWGSGLRQALQRGNLTQALRLLSRKAAGRPAPWNNLEAVQAATARYGAPSTFFILGSEQVAPNGTANADYQAADPAFLARLARLATQGAEVAVHGSYGTALNADLLCSELTRLAPYASQGNRFHYLCWEPRQTPAVLAQAGLRYDSTLGFAEHYGFRHAYCHPFFPFDFSRGQAFGFLEIPLNVMDATLHHPRYLQLQAKQVLPALQPMLAEIEKFGGVATVLWHNDHFDPANDVNGPGQFAEIMASLQQRGAAFLTGNQIVADLCQEPLGE